MSAMKRMQESRRVEISPYGLTRGVELNLRSYSTEKNRREPKKTKSGNDGTRLAPEKSIQAVL